MPIQNNELVAVVKDINNNKIALKCYSAKYNNQLIVNVLCSDNKKAAVAVNSMKNINTIRIKAIAADVKEVALSFVEELNADFSFDPLTGAEIVTEFTFTNLSVGYIDTYHWDFGDGYTSGLENPSHVYDNVLDAEHTYHVTLTITGPEGIDNITKDVIVDKLRDTFIGMAWVDEADPIYTDNPSNYETDLELFKTICDKTPKYATSCQVPGNDVVMVINESIGTPQSNNVDVVLEEIGRPPAASELINRFESLLTNFRAKEPLDITIPEYVVLSVDTSGSMSILTIFIAYYSLLNHIRINYPTIDVRETTYGDEGWLNIWYDQLDGII
jgi:PKD repeat protein